jgi:GNAT superfamily N-acetyltransferase
MSDFSIRLAVSSDIPTLIDLDHGYSTDHVWQMSYTRETGVIGVTFREVRLPRPMRVTYPRAVEGLRDEWTHKAALLVAEGDTGPSAYLTLVEGPVLEAGWITDIVVGLRFRRQGMASALIRAAKEWARAKGMRRLMLEMQSKNYPGIALARKCGFQFTGYSDRYYPDEDIALFFTAELY